MGFAAADAVTGLKLVEAGVPKDKLAMLAIPMMPLQVPAVPYRQYSTVEYSTVHYIISKSDILEIRCSSIALLDKCISQDNEPLQGAYSKI